MVIRRKSDAIKPEPSACKYYRSFLHEVFNQRDHEERMRFQQDHPQESLCWCCCSGCTDLTWYHEEPSSRLTPSGELRPRWGSAALPTSAEISPSS